VKSQQAAFLAIAYTHWGGARPVEAEPVRLSPDTFARQTVSSDGRGQHERWNLRDIVLVSSWQAWCRQPTPTRL